MSTIEDRVQRKIQSLIARQRRIQNGKGDRVTPGAGASHYQQLRGIELVKEAFVVDSSSIVGSPRAGYAIYEKNSDSLIVVSEMTSTVRTISVETILSSRAREVAEGLGGHFTVQGEKVVCTIEEVVQTGDSYGEAALRALLVFIENEKAALDAG